MINRWSVSDAVECCTVALFSHDSWRNIGTRPLPLMTDLVSHQCRLRLLVQVQGLLPRYSGLVAPECCLGIVRSCFEMIVGCWKWLIGRCSRWCLPFNGTVRTGCSVIWSRMRNTRWFVRNAGGFLWTMICACKLLLQYNKTTYLISIYSVHF